MPLTLWERWFGPRKHGKGPDIELPAESGKRDPRLPPPTPEEQAKAFREANEAALKGLKAGRF